MLLGTLFLVAARAAFGLRKAVQEQKDWTPLNGLYVILKIFNNGVLRLYGKDTSILSSNKEQLLWVSTLGCSSNQIDKFPQKYVQFISPNGLLKFRLQAYKFQLQLPSGECVWTNRQGVDINPQWWLDHPSSNITSPFTLIFTCPNKMYQLRLYNTDLVVYGIEKKIIKWSARNVNDTTSTTDGCLHVYTTQY